MPYFESLQTLWNGGSMSLTANQLDTSIALGRVTKNFRFSPPIISSIHIKLQSFFKKKYVFLRKKNSIGFSGDSSIFHRIKNFDVFSGYIWLGPAEKRRGGLWDGLGRSWNRILETSILGQKIENLYHYNQPGDLVDTSHTPPCSSV